MNEELQKSSSSQEEVDLLELALKVWGERKFILKACGYAVLIITELAGKAVGVISEN